MRTRGTRRFLLSVALIPFASAALDAVQDASLIAPQEPAVAAIEAVKPKYPVLALDTATLTSSPEQLAGREVAVTHIQVQAVVAAGFWALATDGNASIFIVPAEGSLITVRSGDFVNLHGEMRLSPTSPQSDVPQGHPAPRWTPYVYAYTVRPGS